MLDDKKIHTTLNLSEPLIKEASRLLKMKNKTDVIHEALRRSIDAEKLLRHALRWVGKGRIRSYE